MDTTENNILLSNNDDELEQEESCSSIGEFELMDNKINEKDWSSSDDDKEITYHHKESSNFKNLDWHQVPFSTSDITWYSMNRHARRKFTKTIWKAVQDEQALRYEIALFKTWLSSSKSSSLTLCTFQDLALTKINNIFTHLIFDKQLSSATNHQTNSIDQFIEDIIMKTISTAETIAENYAEKVNNEKQKVLNNQEKFKKPPTVDSVITAIENRQLNMIQRAQYNIEQILKTIFHENIMTKT
ncbi:unnamed protein product [Adineta steineri]|uniref:Uncharacterized protein n=1 Tax=Adineta steineri TaxID=433720 RepID=A0A815KK61_9BILA|nr:unnamed protein product [Adineta steineri]